MTLFEQAKQNARQGCFLGEQSSEAIKDVVERFIVQQSFSPPQACSENARRFSTENFCSRLTEIIDVTLGPLFQSRPGGSCQQPSFLRRDLVRLNREGVIWAAPTFVPQGKLRAIAEPSFFVPGVETPGAGDAIASSERSIPLSILDNRVLDIGCGSNMEEIHIAVSQYRWLAVKAMLWKFHATPLPLFIPPDDTVDEVPTHPQVTLGDAFAFELPREPLCARERVIKRATDIVISSFGLLVLSPLMLFVSVIIRLDSPGPILFVKSEKV